MKAHDHVVFGALLHDIGKFWERAEMLGEHRRSDDEKQRNCRWNEQRRYFSHLHVLNTRAFCELLTEKLPIVPEPGTDQNWINLAARHHIASTPLEYLVAEADHFASAEREQGAFYEQGIHKKTRLEALLGRVTLGNSERANGYRVPIAELGLAEANLYPRNATDYSPPMREISGAWLSEQSLQADYRRVGEAFFKALDGLPQYRTGTLETLRAIVRNLLALMERFLSTIPAATNVVHPDISLFDHLRITAAIVEGLYLHHEQQGTLDRAEQFKDRETPKWRLVCGDFSGIQNFIYKISSKRAAKALRGRSFYIQLLCDGVSEHLLNKLGLYPTARIYSSGGKFFLLIPAHLEDRLRAEIDAVNAELLKEFQGEVFLGIGLAQVRGSDFQGGNMGAKWKEASESLQRDRLHSFQKEISSDITFFQTQPLHAKHCAVCGRDDADAEIEDREGRATCQQCDQMERIGRSLKDTEYLFWVFDHDRDVVRQELRTQSEARVVLPGTDFDVYLLSEPPELSELKRLESSHLEAINRFPDPDGNLHGYSCGFRFAGKWDKTKESAEWEFDEFAEAAEGIHKLGVLRMDVDNLGEVFIRGLKFGDKDMGSLSRVATLSRQLHLFFAGHLHTLLASLPRTQIIYAGGDDVFLIGSWDELAQVADTIRTKFREYCAGNENFTLSAGIAVVDGRYPISRAAQLAGEAEHEAKALRRGKYGEKEKDALCFLGAAIGWENFERADGLRREICDIMDEIGNRALLGRLRAVLEAVDEFKRLSQAKHHTPEQIQALVHWQKWRWRLVYNIERMAKRHQDLKPRLENLVRQITDPEAKAGQPVLDWLQMPTRWAEFLTRRKD